MLQIFFKKYYKQMKDYIKRKRVDYICLIYEFSFFKKDK
jgi:flavorubredoxin